MSFIEKIDLEKLKDIVVYRPENPMLFNSGQFVLLFMLFYGVYLLLQNNFRTRIIYTILFSIFFYYKSSGFFFWLLILATAFDYKIGHLIAHPGNTPARKKFYLVLSLCYNLGILCYFKYFNFLVDSVNAISQTGWQHAEIFLPVGISFYTFQSLSYSIEVYRGTLKPCRNIWDFAFFVTFFPQLVAGPIVRAMDFLPQIKEKILLRREDLSRAFLLITAGLFKKAVISDYISVNFVDRVFDNPTLYSAFENLVAVYGYAIQIYCDFSGYSDMAIGVSLLLGFKLPLNFDAPYKSSSITEFWRRWHISLSSWLRDYLYISLGGNRKGKVRTYVNLLLTMLIGGLWHGASWKFVLWGALHGVMLALEKFMWSVVKFPRNAFFKLAGTLLTFHFVCFCWIFFRADTFELANQVIGQIGKGIQWQHVPELLIAYKEVFYVIVVGYLLHFIPEDLEMRVEHAFHRIPLAFKSVYLAFIIWVVLQVSSADVQPFIYFQF